MKKKTYIINHILIRGKYYIDKRCTNMGGSKNAKKSNEKKRYPIIYQKTKVQKFDSPKNDKAKKT
jgi:hypothetical protein